MAFDVLKVVSQIPTKTLKTLQRDKTTDINQCGQMMNRYLQGKIWKKFPLWPSKAGSLLKIIVEDDVGKINVFCQDEYAYDMDKCTIGDTLIIANPLVEKSPHHERDGIHRCHFIIGERDQPCHVWVMPKSSNASATDENVTNQVPSGTSDNQASVGSDSDSQNNTISAKTKPTPQPSSATVQQKGDSGNQQSRQAQRTQNGHTSTAASSSSRSGGDLVPSTGSNVQVSTGVPAPRTPDRQVTATAQRTSPKKRSYLYTKLVDVKETNSVNVYGVVKFFKPPRKTRGTDYFMALTLIDPSVSDPHGIDKGLKCVLFQKDMKSLPQVLRVGDIVRLHRIKVQRYNNDLQAKCNAGFASLVFDGRMGTPLKPRSSSAEYTVTQEDKDKVRDLQRWANTVMSSEGLSNPSRRLSDVFIGQYFDLTCQVVAKALLPSESAVLLKVWDGTKCSWPVRNIDVGNRPIEWDATAAFRAEGLTVDVCLYDDHVPAGEKIQPGNYICLYNLHALKYSPPMEADDHHTAMGEFCLHMGTSYGRGVTVMSEYMPDITELIRKLDNVDRTGVPADSPSTNHRPSPQQTNNNRQSPASEVSNGQGTRLSEVESATRRLQFSESSNQRAAARSSESNQEEAAREQSNQEMSSHCMQRSASIITDHVHIKTSSIAEVKAYKEPYLFRVRARVADFLPNDIADFVILCCSKCKLRCKVPHAQRYSSDDDSANDMSHVQTRSQRNNRNQPCTSTSDTPGDETSRRRSPRKKAASSTTRDASEDETLRRKIHKKNLVAAAKQQEIENTDKCARKVAVVHPSNMKKRRTAKRTVKGHKATAEMEDHAVQSQGHTTTVRVTIEDLSVQDALLLAHQGVKLQGYPHNVDSTTPTHDQTTPVYYVCPRCSPADRGRMEEISDDTASLLQYQYCTKLFLRDDTGTIPVVVNGKHAETFFEDILPVNLHDNIESKLNLEEYMRKLCPYPLELPSMSPKTENSHPWLDACIMSYPAQVRGQHIYHLFHTALALDVE